MARTLFPIVSAPITVQSTAADLPMYTGVKWDYDNDKPVFRGGKPVQVTGAEAVTVWAWNALKTVRYQNEMFSYDYGNELESLIGQGFSSAVMQTEAVRYISEALTASPYISAASVSDLTFSGNTFSASVTITTIYGEVTIDV